MPAGYDAEVAELFRDLRAASNLSETDLAARIATPIEVVQALEQGAIYALPPWPETCRVVNAYGTLLNLDTRPLLRRIYAQLEAGIVELRPKPVPEVPVMPPQGGGGDFTFGGNAGAAPVRPQQARPQAPQPQAPQKAVRPQAPQAPGWPNGPQAAPRPRAPQAPTWPGGAPQFPQGGFAAMTKPQAPTWSNGPQAAPPRPQARPAAPQQAPAYQPPPQAYPPEPGPQAHQGEDAYMSEDAYMDTGMGTGAAEPEPKKKKPALLKWGIGALVASVVLVGLWLALGDSSDSSKSSDSFSTSDPVLDPDDPRSRKADRLPNNF